jgi:hypothetical protein
VEAEIAIEYDDATMAEAIADAVFPDNYGTPTGLSVETRVERARVVTKIKCRKSFPTFIATIDDLLFSIATAEKTLLETLNLYPRGQARGPAVHTECVHKSHCSQSFRKHSLW